MGKALIGNPQTGTALFGTVKHFNQEKIDRFGRVSGGVGAIHLDPQFGREKTVFGATLVQGYYQIGLITELMKNNFGPAWVCSGKMEAKLVGPAVAGDTVITGGEITDVSAEAGTRRICCDTWVKRYDGKLLVVAKTEFEQKVEEDE